MMPFMVPRRRGWARWEQCTAAVAAGPVIGMILFFLKNDSVKPQTARVPDRFRRRLHARGIGLHWKQKTAGVARGQPAKGVR